MDRDLLAHLPVVVTVARQKGFAAAAAVLNMSASAVSHAVKAVEDRLGEPLFARTTRSVSLTEAGAKLIATLESALDDIGSAVESLTAARESVVGEGGAEAGRRASDEPGRGGGGAHVVLL